MPVPQPEGTVYVADIINSVKCGLAEALQSEAGRRRLPGTVASVELQLKVVDTRTLGSSSPSALAPVVLRWFGPQLIPTFSASNQQAFTVDTTINLTYRLDAPNISVCNAPGVDVRDKFGFARWLGEVIAGLSKVTPYGPRGTLDKLTYDATFAVTWDGTAGGSLRVVFVDVGANVGRGRADTQHLRIVISGNTAIAGSVEPGRVTRGHRAPARAGVQSLSSSGPSPR
ncbi:MAG: hypothetical protein AB7O43_21015 [Hyphomicrobiaceae bacterium]